MKSFWNLPVIAVLTSMAVAPALAETTVEDKMKTIKPASEVKGQQIGQLDCEIEGGWGLILGSSKNMTCSFKRTDGTPEKYTGKIDKIGLDIGKTETAYMTWIVFTTAENKPGDSALEGEYVGVSAGASLGIGLGANALVGGSAKQIGLQPVSVEGVRGVNLAITLSSLKLKRAE
jgi:hypothetical protein